MPDTGKTETLTTGPEHYAKAERLLALADLHSRGATYGHDQRPPFTRSQRLGDDTPMRG